MAGTEENMRKYRAYKNMFGNLKDSINSKYYLQAVFIEYAMIEDRLASIVRNLLGEKSLYTSKGKEIFLKAKIAKIKNYVNNDTNDYWLKQFLNEELFASIEEWKDMRNKAVHTLLNNFEKQDELEQIAINGKTIADNVAHTAKKVKNHQEKMANKPQKKKPSQKK